MLHAYVLTRTDVLGKPIFNNFRFPENKNLGKVHKIFLKECDNFSWQVSIFGSKSRFNVFGVDVKWLLRPWSCSGHKNPKSKHKKVPKFFFSKFFKLTSTLSESFFRCSILTLMLADSLYEDQRPYSDWLWTVFPASFIKLIQPELAFCRDIPSHEKNPDPEGKKSRIPGVKIPGISRKSRRDCKNPADKNSEKFRRPENRKNPKILKGISNFRWKFQKF